MDSDNRKTKAAGKLDYAAASELTGIKRGTLGSMVCRRQVPHYRVGPRLVLFDEDELLVWLQERRVGVAMQIDTAKQSAS